MFRKLKLLTIITFLVGLEILKTENWVKSGDVNTVSTKCVYDRDTAPVRNSNSI